MNLTIKNKHTEPLLSRTKVDAAIVFDKATPTNKEITAAIASSMKADEKLVVVRHVYTSFGHKEAKVEAYVYDDEAKKTFVEPKVKVKAAPAAK